MKKCMVMLMAGTMLLTGCTESTIVQNTVNGGITGDEPAPVGGIVWEQLWEDLDSIYTDHSDFPFAETVNCSVYGDDGKIDYYLLLNQEISVEEAAEYATTVIKGMGDLIAEQNPDYTPSSEDSYGSFIDQYEIYVMVAPDDTKADEGTWILEDTIPAGEYRAVSAQGAADSGTAETAETTEAAEAAGAETTAE